MIAVTGGGTGGHIFPNISVIEELRRRGEEAIIWIGKKRGKERYWAHKLDIPFYGIRTGKLRRYFSLKNTVDICNVLIGFFQSLIILSKTKPALLFSKGGFVSVPPVIAARVLRIPVITHESDLRPGLSTRIIARTASTVCTSFKKTEDFFSCKKIVHTGNPVREAIKRGDGKRGRELLSFSVKLPVVTVIGGSLGAQSINRAVREMIGIYELPFCLVHQCGKGNFSDEHCRNMKYRQFEFIAEEMGDILAASDLVVSRAGAGALYEIGYMKKPSILVPLSRRASRGEQIENARHFKEHGAAVVLIDEELSGTSLFELITRLLRDKEALRAMGERARALCMLEAEVLIADIILQILSRS